MDHNCRAVLDSLVKSPSLPKVKNSPKGKVLMRAFYGVKVQTVYIFCSVFTAAWSDSTNHLFHLSVSDKPLWAKRSSLICCRDLRGLMLVWRSFTRWYKTVWKMKLFKGYVMELGTQAEKLSQRLDRLLEEVDSFFKMTLSGRDVLPCNLMSLGL